MKKAFHNYLGIWAIALALFNVIAFVPVGRAGAEKYTPSFWVGYVGITLAFAGQLLCAWKTVREENREKLFYNIPLLKIGYHGLVWSFVIGGACMLLPFLPCWLGAILCAIVPAVTAIAVLKAETAADFAEKTGEKVKTQTAFIRLLRVDAENLLSRAKTDAAKAACKKVYEAARYCDPVSNDALAALEEKISERMQMLEKAVAGGEEESVAALAEEITARLAERNRKCKALK